MKWLKDVGIDSLQMKLTFKRKDVSLGTSLTMKLKFNVNRSRDWESEDKEIT